MGKGNEVLFHLRLSSINKGLLALGSSKCESCYRTALHTSTTTTGSLGRSSYISLFFVPFNYHQKYTSSPPKPSTPRTARIIFSGLGIWGYLGRRLRDNLVTWYHSGLGFSPGCSLRSIYQG